jgi:hypothetical protein
MGFAAAKEWLDRIETIMEAANDQTTNDSMSRRHRGFLYDMEDFLDRAKDSLLSYMDGAFGEVEEYRQWGMREGWFDPETDKDFEYADSLPASTA